MNYISKNAVVSSKAQIGDNVTIKHFAVIDDDVIIGDNVEIHSGVQVENGARIESGCKIYTGAVVSCIPQDLKFAGEYTTIEIGENTSVREYCTLNRGTNVSKKTIIGKNCLLMAYVHVAHDAKLGDHVILANGTSLGGHVHVQDWAIIGGLVGVHQFVKVGEHSFIAFSSRITQDVPPYILAGGSPLNYKGLNLVGLKRRGFSEETIRHIKQAYNFIYGSKYNISDALKAIKDSIPNTEEVMKILDFVSTSERGIIRK